MQTLAYRTNVARFGDDFLFDVDSDRSVFAWLSALATGSVAVAAAVHALVVRAHRVAFAVLALTTAYFSLDGDVGLHERLGRAAGHDWQVLYVPVLALTAALLLGIAVRASLRSERWTILLGLALLGASVLLEVALVPHGATREIGGRLYHQEVALEEAAQLAGWVLVGAACLAAAARSLVDLARR